MPQKPKVLIVEDDPNCQDRYATRLEERVEILRALTLADGETLFSEHPDVALIVMDACIPGRKINSEPFVKKMREIFTGPIIAASSDPYDCLDLMSAGCSHSVGEGGKYEVPGLVLQILNIE